MGDLNLKTVEIDEGLTVYCAYDSYVDVRECRPHPKNPNQHPLEQIRLLWKIIKANGFRQAVVISTRSGYVTKGHGRLLSARYGGLKGVPVDYQDYQSEEQELNDLMADNMIQELSYLDPQTVEANISDLKRLNANFDLELLGRLPQIDLTDNIAKLTKAEKVEQADQAGTMPIAARMNERYDYVVIITDNATDQEFLRNLVDVRQERSSKQREIGKGRVIRFDRFMKSLYANRHSIIKAGEGAENANNNPVIQASEDNHHPPTIK